MNCLSMASWLAEGVKRALFEIALWPLIKRDSQLRAEGKRPDKLYWADKLAMRLGMLGWYRTEEV